MSSKYSARRSFAGTPKICKSKPPVTTPPPPWWITIHLTLTWDTPSTTIYASAPGCNSHETPGSAYTQTASSIPAATWHAISPPLNCTVPGSWIANDALRDTDYAVTIRFDWPNGDTTSTTRTIHTPPL